ALIRQLSARSAWSVCGAVRFHVLLGGVKRRSVLRLGVIGWHVEVWLHRRWNSRRTCSWLHRRDGVVSRRLLEWVRRAVDHCAQICCARVRCFVCHLLAPDSLSC